MRITKHYLIIYQFIVCILSITLATYISMNVLHNNEKQENRISVYGEASKTIKADIAKITISVTNYTNNINDKSISQNNAMIREYLESNGISKQDIQNVIKEVNDRSDHKSYIKDKNSVTKYIIKETFEITTKNIDAAKNIIKNQSVITGVKVDMKYVFECKNISAFYDDLIDAAMDDINKKAKNVAKKLGRKISNTISCVVGQPYAVQITTRGISRYQEDGATQDNDIDYMSDREIKVNVSGEFRIK